MKSRFLILMVTFAILLQTFSFGIALKSSSDSRSHICHIEQKLWDSKILNSHIENEKIIFQSHSQEALVAEKALNDSLQSKLEREIRGAGGRPKC